MKPLHPADTTLPFHSGPPSRVLGVDHGERRIGIALSDELRVTARPLLTVIHTNLRADLRSIGRLLRRHSCTEIVIGWPIHLSGDRSPRAEAAEKFADHLRAEFALPVHLWDERMSTAEAHRHLDAVGRRASDRKDVIDQIAAVLILQSWLDARQQHRRPVPYKPEDLPSV
ncbi:MAG TPA: Holliday junction resolvase RuvX [Acidobacteriaceae bacterium]|nr:Holliday junction resolvase RuvX [Acidobacteriaceae bacterium]